MFCTVLMSIDLEWTKLDSSLATYLVDILNRHLGNAERPSFIGPIEVVSLDFGSTPPDVELVDLRDIYRDFLEDDEDEADRGQAKATDGVEDEEGYEWVPRRTTSREEGLPYGSMSMFAAPPMLSPAMHQWNPGMSLPSLADDRAPWSNIPMHRSPSPATPFSAHSIHDLDPETFLPHSANIDIDPPHSQTHHSENLSRSQDPPSEPSTSQTQEPPNPHPNLQLHLHVNWHSDLRITLTTSLRINYPSPMFMSLPIKLSVTGLVFNGELAIAYEGERRRVHICILDDLDPYCPAKREQRSHESFETPSVPLEPDDESPSTSAIDIGIGIGIRPVGNLSGAGEKRPSKPLPVGQRLLPSIYIESEIGQADKHVLKNVTRIERFIQDVIRKTVEEELVFPNFHTLVLGDQLEQQ